MEEFAQRMLNLASHSSADIFSMAKENNPFDMSTKRSWVPVLGEIVWETSAEEEDVGYYAYIFKLEDQTLIGYIRIPKYYKMDKDRVKHFGNLVERFEERTEGLVIDQVDNPGGCMFGMYALLSMLTNKPLMLPRHQVTISEEMVKDAEYVVDNADYDSPENVAYSRLILEEKAAGRGTSERLSTPLFLCGIEQVLPAKVCYTKPIVVLVNGNTISAAEFLAAILKDNSRARIFGQTTAGAGGCVRTKIFPELGGLGLSAPWTIARRTNGDFINDIGVIPDVSYTTKLEDFTTPDPLRKPSRRKRAGYQLYRKTLLHEIRVCLALPCLPNAGASTESNLLDEAQLIQIFEQHQLWRENKGNKDGNHAKIRGMILKEVNFKKYDLAYATFAESDLRKADLTASRLSYANLHKANLKGVSLSEAELDYAYLCDADLSESKLQGANLKGANLIGANLSQTNVSGANLTDATLSGANLTDIVGLSTEQLRSTFIAKDCPVKT